MIESPLFNNFIKKNQIQIVLKGTINNVNLNSNYLLIDKRIEKEEYENIFFKSDFLLISYPESFNLRISALLFECFSNNKICFISNIEAFKVFEVNFNYNPYYISIESLIKNISDLLDVEMGFSAFKNLEMYQPTLKFL